MEDTKNVGGRDRLVRLLLTVVLSIVAVRSLRRGKRLRGILAGVGALGFGFNATTGYCGVNDTLEIDTTTDSETGDVEISVGETESTGESGISAAASEDATEYGLYCASCGEPIVPGQSRGPNGSGETVHDNCP